MGYEYLSFVLAVESTPLMAASNSGHSDVVNVLIKTNADVHLKVVMSKRHSMMPEKEDTQRL